MPASRTRGSFRPKDVSVSVAWTHRPNRSVHRGGPATKDRPPEAATAAKTPPSGEGRAPKSCANEAAGGTSPVVKVTAAATVDGTRLSTQATPEPPRPARPFR